MASITAKITVQLEPFEVPGYVQRWAASGPQSPPWPSIPLADLDEDALEELAWGFVEDLYRKAGKLNPFDRPLRSVAAPAQ